MTFEIDAQLRRDCFVLGRLPFSHVLLLDNAEVPWLILVPETPETELCDLPESQAATLIREAKQIAIVVRKGLPGSPAVEKMNVASIGNIVRQLHVHVIGRFVADAYWPGVVWGQPAQKHYSEAAVQAIVRHLADHVEGFRPCSEYSA